MKIQTILPLALASPVFGCGGQLSSDEAGLMDAFAFVTGGQQEDAIPQGFETRWRRTVSGREIEYQSIGPYAGFGQANDPHRDSPNPSPSSIPSQSASESCNVSDQLPSERDAPKSPLSSMASDSAVGGRHYTFI